MKTKRLNALGIIFASGLAFLVAMLIIICFVRGDGYTDMAVLQRKSRVTIKRYRGGFADRNMIPLVDASLEKYFLDEDGKINKTKGVTLSPLSVRYAKDSVGAHIIGYINSDGNGVSGLEKVFDDCLFTDNTKEVSVVRGANGKLIPNTALGNEQAEDKTDFVMLTIDRHIQKIAEDVLLEHNVTGAVVILDVDSFDILAMASSPAFDRNNVQKYLNSNGSELVNRCFGEYNAGSIFKIVTLCAAFERGLLCDNYTCMGWTEKDGITFSCHKADGHGVLDTKEAFAKSCNCAFYTLGQRLGAENILDAAHSMGLGSRVISCDDLGEPDGNIPDDKNYGELNCINYSIGQGEILITPVQAAYLTCIIAAGGVRKSVNIADSLCTYEGVKKFSFRQQKEERVLSIPCAEYVRECMRLAVTDGTGKIMALSDEKIAGKTGTAETGWIKDGKALEHGWFCGYFPYDNPKYAMAVVAEGGGSGSQSAAPVFKDIAEEINKIYPIG